MHKIKHPATRADRLRIKAVKENKAHALPSSIKLKKLALIDEELADELREDSQPS